MLGIRPEHASVGDRDPQDPSNEVFTALAEDCQISEDGLLLTLSGESLYDPPFRAHEEDAKMIK